MFQFVRVFLCALLALFVVSNLVGCADPNIAMVMQQVKPIVEKAIAETVTSGATFQGGLQGIEPGYAIDVEGSFGPCFKGHVDVKLRGVSGQIMGSLQANGKPSTQPAPAEKPAPTGGVSDAGQPLLYLPDGRVVEYKPTRSMG